MVDFNFDYWKRKLEHIKRTRKQKKELAAWQAKGLSDAMEHFKTGIATNDRSKIESSLFFINYFVRKI